MTPTSILKANPLHWLLEKDPENPGVRYFALRDLRDLPELDPEVHTARSELMQSGPVSAAIPQLLIIPIPGG